jgi:hypothetical protein
MVMFRTVTRVGHDYAQFDLFVHVLAYLFEGSLHPADNWIVKFPQL